MQQNARIYSLDIIRGIAILGILFANLPTMTGLDPFNQNGYTGIDKTIRFLVDIFIQSKFYTIFAFLFGVGFYIFMDNAEKKGYSTNLLFTRRLCILSVFGIVHFVFLWFGDILHAYALAGFILLLFYKRSTKVIFIAGCCFLCISYGLHISSVLLSKSNSINAVPSYYEFMFTGDKSSHTVNLFTHYTNQAKSRLFFLMTEEFQQLLFGLPEYIGLFLIGLWAGKQNIFRRVKELNRTICILQISTLCISVLLSIPIVNYYLHTNTYYSNHVQLWILFGGKTLATFYICSLLLLCERKKWIRRLRPLGAIGKLALTNYIMQSALVLTVLSAVFDDMSKLTYLQLCIFGIGICIIQCICSVLWNIYYKYGPLEWIWRIGIYQK
ncbi:MULTISPECIES: DUF418 domain-containing protein [unclassified Bacillus (in: firmicutes)]|uniref:DUF418 domain-containing protein n=1 Tax=unclassified Bacillus (in: firmicutes) TaxID=185979 RepID=UPI000BF92073|nr:MULTISPECIES: DUF418 domain-containing protein [unclassified Bacillus (in: firmicutes)]PEU18591.1 hypothetical protein CN525_10905 [Bacillus sp. AFS014408]PFW63837.1 hypothetical protein COL20_07290 [Bacillus sp. AFS075034]